jgi:hypothetical protein
MNDGPLIKHAMRRAIQDRRVLVYSTEEGVSHAIEPHAYGITYEDDEVLIGWRCEAKGNGPIAQGGWELVRLDEMRAVRALGPTFEAPRPGYRRGDKRLRVVHAQL